jgi:hypothetical protein
MKNVSVFICVVLLAVSTSIALPEGKEGKEPAKKPVKTEKAAPADSVQAVPVFHWFGPALNMPSKKKDNC